jgi:hypothetical protein
MPLGLASCHPCQDAQVLTQGMASAPIPPGELAALQSVVEAFELPAAVARIVPSATAM